MLTAMLAELRKNPAIISLGLIAAVAGGCNLIAYPLYLISPRQADRTIPAEFTGLAGKTVAVLVVADEAMLYEHADLRTRLGAAVAAELKRYPSQLKKIQVVPPAKVAAFQQTNPAWQSMSPPELASHFKADSLLRITLLDYGLLEPGSANLYRGRIAAEAEVFYASPASDNKARVWRCDEISVSHPDQGRPVARDTPSARDTLRYETDKRFAAELVKKFRSYKVPREQ